MKYKYLLILIMFFSLFITFGCKDNEELEMPITEGAYAYEECVYLALWFSITLETRNEMMKGSVTLVIDHEDDINYEFREVEIYDNLDQNSFQFANKDKFNEENLVKRYDIYLDDEFQNRCLYIDNNSNLYIANFTKFSTGEMFSFTDIFKIKKLYDYKQGVYLLNNIDSYPKYTKEEFLNLIPSLETFQINYKNSTTTLSDINEILLVEKMAYSKSGLYHQWYIIGNNIIFQCYDDIYVSSNSMIFELLYYNDGKIIELCDDVNNFQNFLEKH